MIDMALTGDGLRRLEVSLHGNAGLIVWSGPRLTVSFIKHCSHQQLSDTVTGSDHNCEGFVTGGSCQQFAQSVWTAQLLGLVLAGV